MNKTMVSAVTAITLTATVLTACGTTTGDNKESASSPATTAGAKAAEPTTIKALAILAGGEPPVLENNQALKEIEKRANVKLNVEFVPGDVYLDKVNIAIAAGNQYDMILLTDGKDSKYEKLVSQGAFHDLTDIIKGMKNLQQIPPYTWDMTSVKGKLYGVPRPRSEFGGGNANLFMRKDWLDKYNLQVPKTLDEFTNALKVFKEKDPAGGGKTIPLIAGPYTSPYMSSMNPIAYALGLPNIYKIEGDKPITYFQTPEYKSFLDWVKMAQSSGLIDKDAPVIKGGQSRDKFLAGVGGAFVNNVGIMNENVVATIKKADPKAELVGIPYLEGPGGKKGVQMIEGYFGIWVVPSNVSKDKAKKIVEFLDWSASDDATTILKAGIQGIHYNTFNKELGLPERTDEQKKLFDKEKPNLLILENQYSKHYYVDSQLADVQKAQKAVLDGFEKVGVPNPLLKYLSDTAGKNPDNQKKVTEAAVNYVLNNGDWNAVQAEVDAWSKGMGSTILKELMDQYNESKKK